MSGVARKGRSKWDTREISSDIVEISEDDSPPKKTDDRRKDGDLLPSQDFTTDNGKQPGESSNLKPDALMHQGSAGHEQERTDGLNKDTKERQSKVSSERWQPPRMADEEHNNNDWGKSALEKATGNQGVSKYADDRRRGDAWGTAAGRGYSSRMSSVPDAAWRQRTRSPSPRGAWNRPRRNRSGSRSRSRERGRGRSRSRSPYFDRGSEWRVERGRISGGPSLPCRDFTAGRCRRGLDCRFPHEDGGRRQFDEHYPADSRERYGHQNKDFLDPREPNDFPRSRQSRGHHDEGTWERSEPRRDYRPAEQCHEFVKGRCNRGASCRYAHDDPTSHVGWRDEAREIDHGRGGPDSSYGNRTEHRRENKRPCKFFVEGRCRRGQTCPYLHEEAPRGPMGPGTPDEPPKYVDGRTTGGNYSNWGEQTNHASSHILSRDDRENPSSQGAARSDTGYVYKNRQLEDAGRNQYQIIPQEDFSPQGQNKPEVSASKRRHFSTPIQTSADSRNNEKISGTDGHSASATTGNLSTQTGMLAANHLGGQNLSHIAQSQDAVLQIAGAPTHPGTSQQDATSILPFNSQLHESNFQLHPDRQDQFVASQATANNSGPGMHNQPVPPYLGQNQHGYTQTSQALPDHSMFNGHDFSASGQVPQNRPMSVHAGQSQATIAMSNPGQDSGTQNMQNTHNFQPVAPNMQIQSQILQGLSLAPPSQDNGTPSIQNTHNFLPVAPYMQSQSHTLQALSVLPSSSSADMLGAPVPHSVATSGEDIRRAVTSLAHSLLQPGTAGLQLPQSNMNPNLMINSSGTALDVVQPNPWPWVQQQAGMVQLTHTIPSEQQAPQTFQAPTAVGISNGNPVPLAHSVVPAGHAATSVVNETTIPSENKKGEARDTDGEAPEDGDNKKSKEPKALKMFKLALADFVKEALKPTWKEGQLTREVHKTIVKKVVDKVTSTVENTPQTKEKIDVYMSYSKEKLGKLVQAYVGKYVKT